MFLLWHSAYFIIMSLNKMENSCWALLPMVFVVVMESHSCYVPFFVMFPHHNCKPYANIFWFQNFFRWSFALFSALFNFDPKQDVPTDCHEVLNYLMQIYRSIFISLSLSVTQTRCHQNHGHRKEQSRLTDCIWGTPKEKDMFWRISTLQLRQNKRYVNWSHSPLKLLGGLAIFLLCFSVLFLVKTNF